MGVILRWYCFAEMLNPDLLQVASNSIRSPWLSFSVRKLSFSFLEVTVDGVFCLPVIPYHICLMAAILVSFLIAQFARYCGSAESYLASPHAI